MCTSPRSLAAVNVGYYSGDGFSDSTSGESNTTVDEEPVLAQNRSGSFYPALPMAFEDASQDSSFRSESLPMAHHILPHSPTQLPLENALLFDEIPHATASAGLPYWCTSPTSMLTARRLTPRHPVALYDPVHMLGTSCLACGSARGRAFVCATPLCQRSFCTRCVEDAKAKGVALVHPTTHVCAICDYQSAKRPNYTVHQWHWTFTDHDDLEFTRMLRDSLPAVPGLFLEIHAMRQACWRRRVGGIRKHYSFKQHGGFFEGRLQAIQVAVSQTKTQTKSSIFSRSRGSQLPAFLLTFPPECSLYSETAGYPMDEETYEHRRRVVFEHESLAPSGGVPGGTADILLSTAEGSTPSPARIVSVHSPSAPFSEPLSRTPEQQPALPYALRRKRALRAPSAVPLKREATATDVCFGWLPSEHSPSNRLSSPSSHSIVSNSELMRDSAATAVAQRTPTGLFTSPQSVTSPALLSLCSQTPAAARSRGATVSSDVCSLWNVIPGTIQAVTIQAAQQALTLPPSLSAEEEPRCGICCNYMPSPPQHGSLSPERPDPMFSTCAVEACSRVFCNNCIAERTGLTVSYFNTQSGRCTICDFQTNVMLNACARSHRSSDGASAPSWHTDPVALSQHEFLLEYLRSLPSIPCVWLDERVVEWRVERRVFSAELCGGVLEARWEAIQFAVAEYLRRVNAKTSSLVVTET